VRRLIAVFGLMCAAGMAASQAPARAAIEPLDISSIDTRHYPHISLIVSPGGSIDPAAIQVTQGNEELEVEVAPLPPDSLAVAVAVHLEAEITPEDAVAVRDALGRFVGELPPGAELSIIGAGGDAVVAGRVGPDSPALEQAAAALPLESAQPPHQTLAALRSQLAGPFEGERLLVFVSDEPQASLSPPAQEAAGLIAASPMVFYGVVLGAADSPVPGLVPAAAAGENGHIRPVQGSWQLGGTLDEVAGGLGHRYQVNFRVSGAGPPEVRVKATAATATLTASVTIQGPNAPQALTAPDLPESGGASGGFASLPLMLLLTALPLIAVVLATGFRRPVPVLFAAYAALVPIGAAIELPVPLPAPFNSLSSACGILFTLVAVGHLLLRRPLAPRLLLSTGLWVLFLGVAALTMLWSRDPATTFDDLEVLASLVVLYILVTRLRATPIDLRRVEDAILVGAAIACAYALYLLFTNSLGTGDLGAPRFGRELSGPNHTAASLLLPLAIASHRALHGVTGARRAIYPALVVTIVVVVFLTGSRGGLLGVVATLVVVAVAHRRARALGGYVVAAAVVLFLTFAVAPGSLTSRLFASDSSGRTNIWRVGLSACPDECWTGAGLGTFPSVYEERSLRAPDAQYLRQGADYEPHNVWLLLLVETGGLGLACAGLATVALFREVLRVARPHRAPALGALTGLLVTGFFLSNLSFKYYWLVITYASLVALVHRATPAPLPVRSIEVPTAVEPWTPSPVGAHG
jgi:O-antigen ligase